MERASGEGKTVHRDGAGAYAYRVTPKENYAPATQEAMQAAGEWGLSPTVVDSFEHNNGKRTTFGMDAITGPQGQVFLVNGSGPEGIAHEGLHSGLRREIPEAQGFLTQVVEKVDITTDKMKFVLESIKEAYYDDTGRDFDFNHLKEETAAFLSGMIETDRAEEVFGLTEENAPEIYTAWRSMKKAMGANPMAQTEGDLGDTGEPSFQLKGTLAADPTAQQALASDAVADELLRNRSTLDYLKRRGGLTLTEGMTQEDKRTAVRQALTQAIRQGRGEKLPLDTAQPSNGTLTQPFPAGKSAGKGESAKPGKPVQIHEIDFQDQQAVMDQLAAAQQEVEGLDYEVNFSITPDGKVWRVQGEGSTVNPSEIPGSLIGSYSYHNHPAKKTWYSFSAADVAFFIGSGEAYAKASDHLFEYVMQRTPETLAVDPAEVYHRFKEIYMSDVYQMASREEIDIDKDGFHETMRRLSKEYRFFYERRRKDNGN